jgi:WD40 repeat protein
VTSSDDQSARIWAAEDGQRIATLEGHAGAVTRAEFSPDGEQILTASADGAARLWRAPPSCQALIDAARARLKSVPALTAGPIPPPSVGLLWLYEKIEPLLAFLTPKAGETCP